MIGIVIVNFNGANYQNECINCILNSKYQSFKIIIVDNGSKDNSMKLLDIFDDRRIIKIYNNDNLGVAAGNNIGIKKSIELGCEYTLLLNNDTVFDDNMINNLVSEKKNVVSPKIFYYNSKKIWFFGGKISLIKGNGIHYYFKKEKYKIKKTTKYAPTCCLLIKNTIFEQVGLFDEKYFLYFDDTDFIYRINKEKIKIYLANDSVVYHKVGLSSGGELSNIQIYYSTRNRFYFISKLPLLKRIIPYLFTYFTRLIRKKRFPIIEKGMKDYKNNILGRCDSL